MLTEQNQIRATLIGIILVAASIAGGYLTDLPAWLVGSALFTGIFMIVPHRIKDMLKAVQKAVADMVKAKEDLD